MGVSKPEKLKPEGGKSKLKKGLPKDAKIQQKLDAKMGTKVGPNVVKDVYDQATPDKVLDDPLGKKRPVTYSRRKKKDQ